MEKAKRKINNYLKILTVVFNLLAFTSCGEVQRFYIPEAKLYIQLNDNLFSKSGYIYLSTINNSSEDWIQVQRNANTNLVINLKEPNKIFILSDSYKEERFKENHLKIISCDKDSYSLFYKADNTSQRILKDGFIQIAIGESLDGVWMKKSNMTYFTKIQEIK
jgi:hypothetical protein